MSRYTIAGWIPGWIRASLPSRPIDAPTISACISTISIYSLPNELLVGIAAAGQGCVPGVTFKPEWTLSQVSSRFREAIIGAPTLWTLVEINLDAARSVDIFKLYLKRSGACNMWLSLHHSTARGRRLGDIERERNLVVDRLRQISPHFDRIGWLHMKLSTQWAELHEELFAPLRHIAAPNLQHLEIKFVDDLNFYTAASGRIELFSLGAPRLSFVKMIGIIPFTVPPWTASLTHLEVWRKVDSGLFAAITAQCPCWSICAST
ncbi:hypothetical protein B0H19DRAFT_1098917 [Mycena capillaripes]|nr:hypothetical protein B0H19DRAFT_1098917 [Mycena capillaripes]